MSFRLYPTEQRWWSMADYGAVMDTMQALQPKTVLEFGPGSSTLALIEGGAAHIDTCEDNPRWAAVYRERLVERYRGIVRLHHYRWSDPLSIHALDVTAYDMALIDGPLETERRLAVLDYTMARCRAVLVPIDACPLMVARLSELSASGAALVDVRETGPLAGSFALVTPC